MAINPPSNLNLHDLYTEIGSIKHRLDVLDKTIEKVAQDRIEKSDRLIRIEEKIGYLDIRVTETKQEIAELRQEMRQGFVNIEDKLTSTIRWSIGMSLTTILGVAAIVVAILLQ